jgi:hypothetical protein
MRRVEQAAIAQRLRTDGGGGEGLTIAAVAREMGISVSYAGSLLSDPTGEADRARKRKYLSRCQEPGCGKLCYGSYCLEHAPKGRKNKWTKEAVIEAMQEWDLMHGRPPLITEWDKREKIPGWCPTVSSVYKLFGKGGWNKAIEAAGLTPRPAHFPDWVVQDHAYGKTPMSAEARQRQSEERSALYASDPDAPMFTGLKVGHEKARQQRRRYNR